MSILKEQMLILVSGANNNNKFYEVTLEEGDIVRKRWGRVGSEGTTAVEHTGEAGYNRIIKEKTKKGYEATSVIKTTASTKTNDNLSQVAKKVLAGVQGDPVIDGLIERLVTLNRHEILENSGGLIKVNTDGVITTPLGLVSGESITKAEKILRKIRKTKKSDPERISLLEEYLRIVPQKVPAKRGWQDEFFPNKESVQTQFDLLKQLKDSIDFFEAQEEAVQEQEPEDSIEQKYAKLFRCKIGTLDNNGKEFKRIEKLYNSTKNSMHSASALKLKRVFVLSDETDEQAYTRVSKEIGNERELWHGTQAFNVLSILRKGLFVPPMTGTSIPVVGRLFGNGVYFSDISSKSANYASNYWHGGKQTSFFMFLANVALGNEFKPNTFGPDSLQKAHHGKDWRGRPFNSINIKGGTCGVINNELIVWDTDAIQLKYLCEFDY
jgi:poly [ADP-ribose] polymerase